MQLSAFELFNTGDAQAFRLETANARGNEHGLCHKARALIGFDVKAAVFFLANNGDFFT